MVQISPDELAKTVVGTIVQRSIKSPSGLLALVPEIPGTDETAARIAASTAGAVPFMLILARSFGPNYALIHPHLIHYLHVLGIMSMGIDQLTPDDEAQMKQMLTSELGHYCNLFRNGPSDDALRTFSFTVWTSLSGLKEFNGAMAAKIAFWTKSTLSAFAGTFDNHELDIP